MIHETAIIHPSASIGENNQIGPYTVIGPDVVIGDNNKIHSHVLLKGPTAIGSGNEIYQFASVGEDCQDKKYAGEATRLEIGDNNVFRESVTVHRGTVQDDGLTKVGSGNLFMAYAHVAHDCIIGDNNIFANCVTLAGHVHVGDWVIVGGLSGLHQFCKLGSHAFCAAGSIVVKDIPPYVMAGGEKVKPHGINSEGLKRRGYDKDSITAIRRAYKAIYRSGDTLEVALETLKTMQQDCEAVGLLVEFIQSSERGIIR